MISSPFDFIFILFFPPAVASFCRTPRHVCASPPMFAHARRLLDVIDDVLLQRYHCRALPARAHNIIHGDLTGKTIIVTGSTSGIGITTARALAMRGARVILACRTLYKAHDLVDEWTAQCEAFGKKKPDCRVMALDLGELASVRAFAAEFVSSEARLDVLINNAGIFDMSGAYVRSKDGREQHLQSNFLAPALLSLLLLKKLSASGAETGDARVVFVSSKLHELCPGLDLDDMDFSSHAYGSQSAYASSKLAEVLFVRALDKRVRSKGVRALALHPGNIVTGVVRTLPKIVQFAYRVIMARILLTPEQGARCSLYCATRAEAVASDAVGPYFTSDCLEKLPSAFALDDAASERLWSWTLSELGIHDDI